MLALLRAHLGDDVRPAIADAEAGLSRPLPVEPSEFDHFVFLGRGWSVGLAFEAALKFREAGGAWAESYPAMEYRHGPISVAAPSTLVWFLAETTRPWSRRSAPRARRCTRAKATRWPSW